MKNQMEEIVRLTVWIGENTDVWRKVCGAEGRKTKFEEHLRTIKLLCDNQFYQLAFAYLYRQALSRTYVREGILLFCMDKFVKKSEGREYELFSELILYLEECKRRLDGRSSGRTSCKIEGGMI